MACIQLGQPCGAPHTPHSLRLLPKSSLATPIRTSGCELDRRYFRSEVSLPRFTNAAVFFSCPSVALVQIQVPYSGGNARLPAERHIASQKSDDQVRLLVQFSLEVLSKPVGSHIRNTRFHYPPTAFTWISRP